MIRVSRSGPSAWLFMLRMIGMIGGIATIMVGLFACQSGNAGKPETLTIATVPTEVNALFYMAEARNFFASNGLQVLLKEDYDSGAAATAAMLKGEGEVDAVVIWEPLVTQINKHMGKEVTIKALQSNQYAYWNLVMSTPAWTREHSEAIVQLVKSLTRAEDYIVNYPYEAKAYLQKRMNLEPAYMEVVWPRYQISLSLDQSLILAMEDEARWLMNNNLTTEKRVPDFLNYIYTDGLGVKPNAVNIIH